jgi:D-lactate dehydrogenase
MTQRKVIVFDSKSYDEKTFKSALKTLNGQDKLHFTFLESKLTDETVGEAQGFDAICVFVNDVVNENVLEELHKKCDTVKIVALRCAGFNNVHLETAEKYNIKVCRVPRYSPYAVAEHSVALLLSLNRNMHHAFFRTKQHNFSLDGLVGIDLFGKTVGIIGTGGIGMCAINIFLGFGCKVLAYDIFPNEQAAKEKGFQYVTMDELLRQSDVGMRKIYIFFFKNDFCSFFLVSIYAPLLDSTYHLINKEALEKMKNGAMLINTSRGPLIDSKALVDCLKLGKLRGAALDVYENEEKYFYNDFSQQV